jgi:hypothetical protein
VGVVPSVTPAGCIARSASGGRRPSGRNGTRRRAEADRAAREAAQLPVEAAQIPAFDSIAAPVPSAGPPAELEPAAEEAPLPRGRTYGVSDAALWRSQKSRCE